MFDPVNPREFLQVLREASSKHAPAVLIVGAGTSLPQIPPATPLKHKIVDAVCRRVQSKLDSTLEESIRNHHMTLEVLCALLRYRCDFNVSEMWRALCDVAPNSFACYVA